MTRSLAALLLLLAALPAAGLPALQREVLPGGLELLVVPVEGARTASLRYVVRAGSERDPAGKEGLAHLLEHLLVRGSPGEVGLVEAARGEGASLNAFTSREATRYVLDAPAETFGPLAERTLRAITNPSFRPDEIERELGVVGQEGVQRGGGEILAAVERAVYRAEAPSGTTLGQDRSRARIERADLIEFFQRHYATSNTTVILTGAVSLGAARALLDRALLLPPALPGETSPRGATSPALPVTEKLRAPFIAAVLGYALASEDRAACQVLADVIELRMFVALHVREPQLRSIQVGCHTLRGTEFLLAMGYAPTLEATDLPEVIERIFREASTHPPGPRERQVLEQRLGRLRDHALEQPETLAEEAADSAVRRGEGGRTEVPSLSPQTLPVAAMQAAGPRSFTAERRVLILLSPFEG